MRSYMLLHVRGELPPNGRGLQVNAGSIGPDLGDEVLVRSKRTGEYRVGEVTMVEKRDRTVKGGGWTRTVVVGVRLLRDYTPTLADQ